MARMNYDEYGDIRGNQMRLQSLVNIIDERRFVAVMPNTSIPSGKAIISCSKQMYDDMKKTIAGQLKFTSPTGTGDTFLKRYGAKAPNKYVLTATYKSGNTQGQKLIKLNDLEKTPEDFGGGAGSGLGRKEGDLAEGAACWVGAYRFSLGETDIDRTYRCTLKDFDSVKDKVETKNSMTEIHTFLMENSDWMESSILTANSLWNSKYKNKNYHWYHDNDFMKQINKHFLKVNARMGDEDEELGRPFSDVNKWNPADIWLCDCGKVFPKEDYFTGWNQKLYDLVKSKTLVGVSLKKISGSTPKLEEVNMDRDKTIFKKFTKAGANTLFNSMDVYIEGDGFKLQMRDTAGKGKTWQGEITGGASFGKRAKGGKVGGGIFDRILQEVYGIGNGVFKEYSITNAVRAAEQNPSPLDQKIYNLLQKDHIKSRIVRDVGGNSYKRDATKVAEEVTMDEIRTSGGRSGMNKSQWKFSKYFGMTVLDIMFGNGNTAKQRDELSTRLYKYASSQSDLSGPFIKVS